MSEVWGLLAVVVAAFAVVIGSHFLGRTLERRAIERRARARKDLHTWAKGRGLE